MHPRKYFALNFFINEIFSVEKFPNYGMLVEYKFIEGWSRYRGDKNLIDCWVQLLSKYKLLRLNSGGHNDSSH